VFGSRKGCFGCVWVRAMCVCHRVWDSLKFCVCCLFPGRIALEEVSVILRKCIGNSNSNSSRSHGNKRKGSSSSSSNCICFRGILAVVEAVAALAAGVGIVIIVPKASFVEAWLEVSHKERPKGVGGVRPRVR